MLNNEKYSYTVDWWALGILVYEMMVGFPPFYTGSADNAKMYKFIKSSPVFFPDPSKHKIYFSDDCKDFIVQCLCKNQKERLGSTLDVDEVLAHPWFKNIDFNGILEKTVKAPFKPKLNKYDNTDTQNFQEYKNIPLEIASS